MAIRSVTAADQPRIHAILVATGAFTPAEVECADELVAEAVEQPDKGDYFVFVLEDEGAVQGYVCYGDTPLTEGTHDLYWIAVDPARHGRKYGQALLEQRVADLEGAEAGLALASGMAALTATFWSLVKAGDRVIVDKIVYGKYLSVG